MPLESVKRTRISQACEGCRAKKTKCDGKHPICSQCASLGLLCSYDPAPKKRGLPAGHSVMLERKTRLLEFICSLFLENVEGSAQAVQGILNSTGSTLIPTLLGGKGEEIDHLSQSWKDSSLAGSVDSMLNEHSDYVSDVVNRDESIEPTVIRQLMPRLSWPSRVGSLDSSTTFNQDQALAESSEFLLDALSTANVARTTCRPGFLGSTSFVTNPESIALFWNNEISRPTISEPVVVRLPPLPPNTQHLVNVYFSYTHIWLPIVDKYKLIRMMHRYTTESSSNPLSNSSRASLALLWSVLAYTMAQSASHLGSSSSTREAVMENVYHTARNLIPAEASAYELEDVQALCLLSLRSYGCGWWLASWMLIGMAGRIATDIGLGQALPTHSTSRHHSLQRRTLYGCFVVETLIAARLGRQAQLHTSMMNCLHDEPRDDEDSEFKDGWEEWGSWEGVTLGTRPDVDFAVHHPTRSLSVFNHLVHLMEVLSEVLISYTRRLSERALEQTWQELMARCNEWESKLGVYCALHLPDNGTPLPHILHLHMMHSTVRNLLLIRFRFMQVFDAPNEAQHEATQWATATAEIAKQFTNIYVEAVVPPTFSYSIAVSLHSPSCPTYTAGMLLQILGDLGDTWPAAWITAKVQRRAPTSKSPNELLSEAANLAVAERGYSGSSSLSLQRTIGPEEETQIRTLANVTPELSSSTMSFAPRSSIAWPSNNGGDALQDLPTTNSFEEMPLMASNLLGPQLPSRPDPASYASINTDEQLAMLDAPDLTDDGIAQFMSNLGYFGDLDENYNFIDHLGHSPTERSAR